MVIDVIDQAQHGCSRLTDIRHGQERLGQAQPRLLRLAAGAALSHWRVSKVRLMGPGFRARQLDEQLDQSVVLNRRAVIASVQPAGQCEMQLPGQFVQGTGDLFL